MSAHEDKTQENEYDADYLKGFEAGYDLAMWAPEIAKELPNIKSNAPYIDGLKDGNAVFLKAAERSNEQQPKWLQRDYLSMKLGNNPKLNEQDKGKENDLEL